MSHNAPRVLITRPRHDAAELAEYVTSRGGEALIEPMLSIENIDGAPLSLDGVWGFLATSANGVRALAARTDRRDIPVYAVGDATARTATMVGFATVYSAGGDVEALARMVIETVAPNAGVLLHAAGSAVAGDLAGQLTARGYAYRREELYRAQTAMGLSETTARALAEGSIGYVLFFSPRTAKTFVTLAAPVTGAAGTGGVTALCLSAAVADKVRDLAWRDVLVADRPDQAALLRLLGKVLPDPSEFEI